MNKWVKNDFGFGVFLVAVSLPIFIVYIYPGWITRGAFSEVKRVFTYARHGSPVGLHCLLCHKPMLDANSIQKVWYRGKSGRSFVYYHSQCASNAHEEVADTGPNDAYPWFTDLIGVIFLVAMQTGLLMVFYSLVYLRILKAIFPTFLSS